MDEPRARGRRRLLAPENRPGRQLTSAPCLSGCPLLLGEGIDAGTPVSVFGCANSGDEGLKPFTMSQMPKASSKTKIGMVARPSSAEPFAYAPKKMARSSA